MVMAKLKKEFQITSLIGKKSHELSSEQIKGSEAYLPLRNYQFIRGYDL